MSSYGVFLYTYEMGIGILVVKMRSSNYWSFLSFMRYLPFIVMFILFIFISTLSYAKDVRPQHAVRWYKVYWLKGRVGDLVVGITPQADGGYFIESHMNSRGVAKKLFKFWSVSTSTARAIDGDRGYYPIDFQNESRLRNRIRTIDLHFNPNNGALRTEAVTPPDNRDKRPAVPDLLKQDVVDPHTSILIAHRHILHALKWGIKDFMIPGYDARRRYNLYFTLHGKKVIQLHGEPIQVVHVGLRRHVIAGMTEREKERHQDEEPSIDLYLEDTPYLLPVKIVAEAPIGSAVAIFERDCEAVAGCRNDD